MFVVDLNLCLFNKTTSVDCLWKRHFWTSGKVYPSDNLWNLNSMKDCTQDINRQESLSSTNFWRFELCRIDWSTCSLSPPPMMENVRKKDIYLEAAITKVWIHEITMSHSGSWKYSETGQSICRKGTWRIRKRVIYKKDFIFAIINTKLSHRFNFKP